MSERYPEDVWNAACAMARVLSLDDFPNDELIFAGAIMGERERCANVCERLANEASEAICPSNKESTNTALVHRYDAGNDCAERIRGGAK